MLVRFLVDLSKLAIMMSIILTLTAGALFFWSGSRYKVRIWKVVSGIFITERKVEGTDMGQCRSLTTV